MMKRLLAALLVAVLLCVSMSAVADGLVKKDMPQTEALEFTSRIRVGWNLGNTFDASDCNWLNNLMDYESAWCGVKTKEAMFDLLVEAGFNAVRIPVSWHNHVSGDDYTIDEQWMNRVQKVVDWAYSRDMYVILNIHHDNSTKFLYPSSEYMDQSRHYVSSIWQQIATRFADYDEHLIYDGMNEPRLVGHKNEWWIDMNNAEVVDALNCINELNQVFVDTVRACGGMNETRYLMCPGYDASPEGCTNKVYKLPVDPIETNNGHILVSVHAYTPYHFALEENGTDKWSSKNNANLNDMTYFMQSLYTTYICNGVGVIIDEFGARNRNGNTEARADFAATYVKQAWIRGIPTFWWDNNAIKGGEEFCLLNRKTVTWEYPEITEALTALFKDMQ